MSLNGFLSLSMVVRLPRDIRACERGFGGATSVMAEGKTCRVGVVEGEARGGTGGLALPWAAFVGDVDDVGVWVEPDGLGGRGGGSGRDNLGFDGDDSTNGSGSTAVHQQRSPTLKTLTWNESHFHVHWLIRTHK
jgi:hypothetical protein